MSEEDECLKLQYAAQAKNLTRRTKNESLKLNPQVMSKIEPRRIASDPLEVRCSRRRLVKFLTGIEPVSHNCLVRGCVCCQLHHKAIGACGGEVLV